MQEKFYKARELRNNLTIHEKRLWNLLKGKRFHGLKFRRQYPIGNYIVDFVSVEIKLVIEIDGGQHNEPDSIEYDAKRTGFLEEHGYRVLRFWNNDIYTNIDGVISELERVIFEIINPS